MRYSLSSRFRGTLIGMVIGDIGKCGATTKHFSCLDATPHTQRQLLNRSVEQHNGAAEALAGRFAVLGAESLIRLGRFDLDDWRHTFRQDSLLRLLVASPDQNGINYLSITGIVATLPIALFYHENEIKLRQNLQLALTAVGHDPVSRDGALAVGYAIAQSLNEKLNAATLIPEIISFIGEPQTQITQHLAQVQTLLEQRAGLERAVTELRAQPSTPIALAFYCFLSTLEDLRLSVMRAALTRYQPHVTSTITGALSGAYNSTFGIPINWRLALSGDPKLGTWGITEIKILQISDSLVAVWSGVYDQVTHPPDLTQVAAIAAPRVIRSR